MVSQITEGSAVDKNGDPFRRRNFTPGLIAVGVLAVIAAVVWMIALTRPPSVHEATVCNTPPAGDANTPSLGPQVTRSEMAKVTPATLTATKIRVLNASGHGGQAGEVSGALRDLGFAQPTAANDPVYANTKLTCQGQIRFGPKGQAAAASVWLVAPCTELFKDTRDDDSVDLAIGTDFTTLTHNDDIDAVLAGLRPEATEPADPALLTKIHSVTC